MDILVRKYGIISLVAMCNDCNYENDGYKDPQKLRREVYKHIRETGHRVIVQKVVDTLYYPEGKE